MPEAAVTRDNYRIANQQRRALEWIRMSTTRLVFGYVTLNLFLFSEACAHAIGLHAKQSPQTNTPPDTYILEWLSYLNVVYSAAKPTLEMSTP